MVWSPCNRVTPSRVSLVNTVRQPHHNCHEPSRRRLRLITSWVWSAGIIHLLVHPIVWLRSDQSEGVVLDPNRFFGFLIPEGEGQARGEGTDDEEHGGDYEEGEHGQNGSPIEGWSLGPVARSGQPAARA